MGEAPRPRDIPELEIDGTVQNVFSSRSPREPEGALEEIVPLDLLDRNDDVDRPARTPFEPRVADRFEIAGPAEILPRVRDALLTVNGTGLEAGRAKRDRRIGFRDPLENDSGEAGTLPFGYRYRELDLVRGGQILEARQPHLGVRISRFVIKHEKPAERFLENERIESLSRRRPHALRSLRVSDELRAAHRYLSDPGRFPLLYRQQDVDAVRGGRRIHANPRADESIREIERIDAHDFTRYQRIRILCAGAERAPPRKLRGGDRLAARVSHRADHARLGEARQHEGERGARNKRGSQP